VRRYRVPGFEKRNYRMPPPWSILFACVFCLLLVAPSMAQQQSDGISIFIDVPVGQWAADAVKQLTEQGLMKGYPDSTFRGNRPVTRYELAVTIARFVELLTPVSSQPVQKQQQNAAKHETNAPAWASNSIELLKKSEVLPSSSPIITDGSKPATVEDLAQALAAAATKIIESRVPHDTLDDN
jgi:hypothetical protein